MENLHLINDIAYKDGENFNMVVEIPAGTNEKWQTNAVSGALYFEHVNGKPRIIDYLAYPFNYGFIPQTVDSRERGGDGDPLDVVLIGPALQRGSVQKVKMIGALKFMDQGEEDTKIVAVLAEDPLTGVDDIPDLLLKYYGSLEIIRFWFEGYKGPGSLFFHGYALHKESLEIIETTHLDWQRETRDVLAAQTAIAS